MNLKLLVVILAVFCVAYFGVYEEVSTFAANLSRQREQGEQMAFLLKVPKNGAPEKFPITKLFTDEGEVAKHLKDLQWGKSLRLTRENYISQKGEGGRRHLRLEMEGKPADLFSYLWEVEDSPYLLGVKEYHLTSGSSSRLSLTLEYFLRSP